ncbi:PE-PGRS family protein [Streptomyces sp. NBC_00859]|uniref:PE-PGRS family protein n=1 Tax=Streptomyces sp. NBC_00859 TaxID=2903682 RepID=UPI0038705552|nr:PE-PGRS family protein [Streptomyces sp. NBC_00859]
MNYVRGGVSSMRMVDPDQLNQLAKLLSDKGGVTDKLTLAFTRARHLGVTDKLVALKPLHHWSDDTAVDLRRRAGYAYLENAQPLMALATWAGLRTADAERRSNESLSAWEDRLKAKIITLSPGLAPYESEIDDFLGDAGDVTGFLGTGGMAVVNGVSMAKILGGNSLRDGWLAVLKTRVGAALSESDSVRLQALGVRIRQAQPALRTLSAPGAWLPSRIGSLFMGNSLYRFANRIPFTAVRRDGLLGDGWDMVRSHRFVQAIGVGRVDANGIADILLGSDEVASRYGGATHSGDLVRRSANASLFKVARSQAFFQKAANTRPAVVAAGETASPLLKGLAAAGKAAGFLRGAGIAGSAVSAGFSTANVLMQGTPGAAFKEKGAGYIADIAEAGFNTSMTAAMIAPNPLTVGFAVGTGLAYGGAKVVQHWDGIKKGAGEAAGWVGVKAKGIFSDIENGASSIGIHASPGSWF